MLYILWHGLCKLLSSTTEMLLSKWFVTLRAHPGHGTLLHADSLLCLVAYYDSDWASCPVTWRSVTRYIVFLSSSPISWNTKKQHTISRSSAEAEYQSMAFTLCEIKWLSQLLRDLWVYIPHIIPIYYDSQAAIHITANPVFHEWTKYIEIDCHFVCNAFQSGISSP